MAGLNFSKETLEKAMNALTEENAMRMMGLAGGRKNLEETIEKLASAFNALVPASAFDVIARAGRRYNKAYGSMALSYNVAA